MKICKQFFKGIIMLQSKPFLCFITGHLSNHLEAKSTWCFGAWVQRGSVVPSEILLMSADSGGRDTSLLPHMEAYGRAAKSTGNR